MTDRVARYDITAKHDAADMIEAKDPADPTEKAEEMNRSNQSTAPIRSNQSTGQIPSNLWTTPNSQTTTRALNSMKEVVSSRHHDPARTRNAPPLAAATADTSGTASTLATAFPRWPSETAKRAWSSLFCWRKGPLFKTTADGVDASYVDDDDRDDAGPAAQALVRLAEALPVGVVQVDARGVVVFTNERLHALVGTPRAATVDEQFSGALDDDGRMVAEVFDVVLRSGLDDDVVVRFSDGRRLAVNVHALTKGTNVISGAIACVTDVTDGERRRGTRLKVTIDEVTRCHDRASTLMALEMSMRWEMTLCDPE